MRNMSQIRSTPTFAVLYESDDNHGDGLNIAFADGHVEFQNLDHSHATIRDSKTQLDALH